MKKMLSTLLLGGVVLGATLTPALAENYKLYDPVNNKSYTAQLMPFLLTDHTYIIGLKTSQIECAILGDTNTNANGLVGGNCYFGSNRVYNWRELTSGSYNSELSSIITQRKKQGLYYVRSNDEAQAIETKLRRNNNSGLRDPLWERTN